MDWSVPGGAGGLGGGLFWGMMSKVCPTATDAFADLKDRGIIFDGMTVMVGGFGLCGIPEQLIVALRDTGVKRLTCISNNAGVDMPTPWGLGLLLETRQIRKMISSYVGENATFEKQFLGGELEIEFNPQGTLAERIRAGGAGIPAFYTATGVGTVVAEGKEVREFYRPYDDTSNQNRAAVSRATGATKREYVLETGLYADLALVKASRGDEFGNLIYNKTARNFNPMMATAAKYVLAEVEDLLATGSFDPDRVHTPGNYVDRVVKTVSVKRIEQRTVLGGKPAKG
jgi:3-oxoacid CoA-transferase subunit A